LKQRKKITKSKEITLQAIARLVPARHINNDASLYFSFFYFWDGKRKNYFKFFFYLQEEEGLGGHTHTHTETPAVSSLSNCDTDGKS
jgi:hypothetical protein